ncbi:hypothetical protein [Collinsella aerofaciens]|uniref:hypothetical protein n=1 Tax=Collinsella aerofaciens TaxID=74426 RepID=UPI003D795F15
MASDEQRREVAEMMRGYDVSEFKESAIVPFLDCLGVGYLNWREVLDTLADLIDRPTCRIILARELRTAYGKPITGINGYMLSCGHQAVGFEKPRYCPECGMEVGE